MTIDQQTYQAIIALYANYAACLDDGRFDEWPDFFTEEAWYRIVARENHDRNLPLSTLSLKGRPMMKDRIYGITSTIYHAPYYQRHLIGLPIISQVDAETFNVEVNYTVFRTKRDMPADILSTGKYIDEITYNNKNMKFSRKFCVFDNDLIPNSLIYPI